MGKTQSSQLLISKSICSKIVFIPCYSIPGWQSVFFSPNYLFWQLVRICSQVSMRCLTEPGAKMYWGEKLQQMPALSVQPFKVQYSVLFSYQFLIPCRSCSWWPYPPSRATVCVFKKKENKNNQIYFPKHRWRIQIKNNFHKQSGQCDRSTLWFQKSNRV